MAILIAVRNIYYDAAPYGYTDNDLKTGIEFITDQDYSHQIADISNVLEIDPALVYAIIRAESSFNSPMFLNKHNPGGLKFDGVFATFPSTTAGFAEEALEILKYRIDGKVTIEQIGATYVGSKDPNKSKWFDNVNNIYHEAIANYDTLFGSAPTQTPPSNSNEPDFIEPTPPKVESTIEKITSKIETTITNAIDTYNKRIEQLKEEKQYIKKYSDIYGLDYEKIYQILSDLTNHFQDKNYQNNFIIGQSKLGNQKITCKSKEMAILIATYNIYYDPEQYGYSLDELKTDTKYISELDNVEQITSISNILDIDPALTYAICKTQCNFDSDIFLKNNNPGKLRMNGTYATFPSTTAGFIEQAIEILKLEINDQTTTIEQIIAKYSIISNNANQFWITTVNTNYKDAITNPTILSKLPYTEPETIIDQKESILEGNNIKTNLTNMMETFIQMKTILSEAAKNPEEKKYIKKYCDIYGLDNEKVYQILSDITDSFQNKAYQENYTIGDSKLKGRNVVCKNKEMAILIAVRNIYHNEENYIKQYGNLKINIEYQNERDYPQQIAEISNVLGTNPALTYAICKARTNDFNNELFLINNNPGGLKFNKINYETFPTQTAGFVEATLEVLKYQIDGKTVITEIGIDYTHTPNDTWNQEITKNYTEAMQHYQDLFEQVKEKTYTLENK